MISLLVGGARSGKSMLAEDMARRHGIAAVTYVATGSAGNDLDMAARIAAHRQRRPPTWTTFEATTPEVVPAVAGARGTLVLDSLTAWVAAAEHFAVDIGSLCTALRDRTGDSVVVSDEVGLGVHPSTDEGRRFRDALGLVNQAMALVADEVLLVVAGRTLRLNPMH